MQPHVKQVRLSVFFVSYFMPRDNNKLQLKPAQHILQSEAQLNQTWPYKSGWLNKNLLVKHKPRIVVVVAIADLYILDTVPPIHVVYKLTTVNGGTFTSSSASLSSQSR